MTTLEKLIDQDPEAALNYLREKTDMDDGFHTFMDAWHMDWFEKHAFYSTKFNIVQNWFESDKAGDSGKWAAIKTWAEFTPGGRKIIRLTAKEICPELFIRPQLETRDTTLADTYRTELLQKISDNHSLQELEKMAGI